MKVTYYGRIFSNDDFVEPYDSTLPTLFLADVEALITPSPSEIGVDILSIKLSSGQMASVEKLRKESQRALVLIMRTLYLNHVRAGREGDVYHYEREEHD